MRYFDEEGCNLDPTKCDCGKGYFCPLWNEEWAELYDVDLEEMTKLQEWAEVHEVPENLYRKGDFFPHSTVFLESWVECTNIRIEYFKRKKEEYAKKERNKCH